jgi:hypothetical protein
MACVQWQNHERPTVDIPKDRSQAAAQGGMDTVSAFP